jgi:hypothetical protein
MRINVSRAETLLALLESPLCVNIHGEVTCGACQAPLFNQVGERSTVLDLLQAIEAHASAEHELR